MQLTFLGATGTVTGSKYLLKAADKKVLVDCGLFQGYKELRLRNWSQFPVDPKTIEAIILTHAHVDHTGYIPLLVKNGFKGKIFSTPATKDLCSILLPDSGFLQEEEARITNKFRSSKHETALPLYTEKDAITSLKHFETVDFHEYFKVAKTFKAYFHHAGHILGAACVQMQHQATKILFSGDLGRPHDPVMRAPDFITQTDYLVLESTYGNRLHEHEDAQEKLGHIIRETVKRGGTLIIPAFAVGRAQSILYYLYQLRSADKIPHVPIFLDSPMATDATHIFERYGKEHRLDKSVCAKVCALPTYVKTFEESSALDEMDMPAIIISASGMASGGRVLHHLKARISDYRNTILFTGYQAGGTRGERMMSGEGQVKIYGEMITIKAQIESLSDLSAHADYEEILEWLSHFEAPPLKTFLTHGAPESAMSLRQKIIDKLGWHCEIPNYLQKENL